MVRHFSRANQVSCNISNPHLTSLRERSIASVLESVNIFDQLSQLDIMKLSVWVSRPNSWKTDTSSEFLKDVQNFERLSRTLRVHIFPRLPEKAMLLVVNNIKGIFEAGIHAIGMYLQSYIEIDPLHFFLQKR